MRHIETYFYGTDCERAVDGRHLVEFDSTQHALSFCRHCDKQFLNRIVESGVLSDFIRRAEAVLDGYLGGPTEKGEPPRSILFAAEAVANGVKTLLGRISYLEAIKDAYRVRSMQLEDFVRDCRDNHDHREDAHKYNTPCFVCEAEKLLPKDGRQRERTWLK
jgi:hypothetical protein